MNFTVADYTNSLRSASCRAVSSIPSQKFSRYSPLGIFVLANFELYDRTETTKDGVHLSMIAVNACLRDWLLINTSLNLDFHIQQARTCVSSLCSKCLDTMPMQHKVMVREVPG